MNYIKNNEINNKLHYMLSENIFVEICSKQDNELSIELVNELELDLDGDLDSELCFELNEI